MVSIVCVRSESYLTSWCIIDTWPKCCRSDKTIIYCLVLGPSLVGTEATKQVFASPIIQFNTISDNLDPSASSGVGFVVLAP